MRRRTFLTAATASLAAAACRGTSSTTPPVAAAAPGADPFSRPEAAPLLDRALAAATDAGATYADARIVTRRTQSVSTREARVTRVSDEESHGIGVRVVVDGTWGFAASAAVTLDEVDRLAKEAVAMARRNARLQRDPVRLAPVEPQVGTWQTPIRRDPFEVPIEEKVQRLLAINRIALDRPGIRFCSSWMAFVREHKLLATTDGTRVEQVLHRCAPSFTVTSVDERKGGFRTRNALAAPQGRGYEFVEDYDWDADVRQAAEDAVAMHTAKPVEPGRYDLVLLPSHLWLTIHESIGHPTELDRSLGFEANYAGTSFITPDDMGRLKIGSDIVSFTAERTAPGALATAAWDDDGVPTTRWPIVKDGVFVDFQTTRDQAHFIGRDRSYACSYAQSWQDVAFQRMPNINLESPDGGPSLGSLIGGTDRGILIAGRGSYSIDHQRYNFQFGGQTFHEIRDGKVVGPLVDVAYVANTVDFWNSCDAICNPGEYEINGSFYDGKGEPGQVNAVSHGCATARFRDITVLNTGRS